ncbi:Ger(x)C family spore germination protein [Clostridium lundense]|uniref:Ger(x)C family spore germination protein n=1 Tax=Clostridium lundense TaxID=319475 RepID=UPI00047FE53D|nr:Ger(x)C family spore germination protein [Clostridium lundense]
MKKIKLSIILCMCVLFNGCYNYRDINKIIFSTAIVIDIDEQKNPVFYMETFKPYRSAGTGSDKGERIVYKGKGKAVFEALRDVGLATSYKPNGTQCKAIIFTEKAAAYGIDNFLDFFDRDQEFLIRQYVAIFEGDVDRLIKMRMKSEEYIGIFLVDLMDNIGTSSRAIRLSLNDYLNKRIEPAHTSVMTVLKINSEQIEEMLSIDGGAIIKEDKMVDRLPRAESQGYNFIIDKVKSGTLEVSNPEDENKFVVLEIRRSKTKTKLDYDGSTLKLKKIINVTTSFGEAQRGVSITGDERDKIARGAEKNIKTACMNVFNKYKNKNLDIFEVERRFKLKYPKADARDVLKNTEIDVEVNVKIEGSSNKFNFKK